MIPVIIVTFTITSGFWLFIFIFAFPSIAGKVAEKVQAEESRIIARMRDEELRILGRAAEFGHKLKSDIEASATKNAAKS